MPNENVDSNSESVESPVHTAPGFLDLLIFLRRNVLALTALPIAAGLVAYAASYLLPNQFKARTTVIIPQQQSTAAAMLQSLGGLAGLSNGVGIKSPSDQYVALMQSATITDRMVKKYKLVDVYQVSNTSAEDVRIALREHVKFSIGKKDGLLSIEVTDVDPQRAAAMANNYVEQLRGFSSELAMSEARQRRVFFEKQLKQTHERLSLAQAAVQESGINEGAIRAEPRAATSGYATVKAQVAAAEVTLQGMKSFLTPQAPEYKLAQTNLSALKAQLARLETNDSSAGASDYIRRYREYRYQEALFDIFAKQYEVAKLDESKEEPLIQVVDVAMPPERKISPNRAAITMMATLFTGVMVFLVLLIRQYLRILAEQPDVARKLATLRGR